MRNDIERTLHRLVGQPLWAVGRAASLTWFQFGDRRLVSTRQGDTKEVGSYALHLQCPWSWSRSWGEVIADNFSSHEELSGLLIAPVTCDGIEARDDGAFQMTFADHTVLVVVPTRVMQPDEYDEYWRFFVPYAATPHFVVGPRGVDNAVYEQPGT
jgi:hypothetical protein